MKKKEKDKEVRGGRKEDFDHPEKKKKQIPKKK